MECTPISVGSLRWSAAIGNRFNEFQPRSSLTVFVMEICSTVGRRQQEAFLVAGPHEIQLVETELAWAPGSNDPSPGRAGLPQ